ncbi:thioredoxin family protein [Flavobacterium sp. RHBU_24]|uniref:thioredoxin family protein n=1 Tax=Flavobacterium sp. RHBU_24 TaxID=3391185 RepID=UPI003984BEE9
MTTTDAIIQQSLSNSFTYAGYRQHVTTLLEQGLSTGATQSEALTHYTTLNEARMNRLDKTIHLPDEILDKLQHLDKTYTFLVITEGWCGDAAQIVPVINKMVNASDKIEMKLVLRDDNPELMDAYLTNGARSIPKLVVLDAETQTPVASWGPRPEGGTNLIKEAKERDGVVTDETKTDLQKWYLHDKGLSTMSEIIEKLN